MSITHTRVAIEQGEDWTEITAAGAGEVACIAASDLREAQQRSAVLHAEAPGQAVFLDLEIHIAADARSARKEFATLDAPAPRSIRYIGTASGLAGLVADVAAAEVADGVTLTVFAQPDDQFARVRAEVVPLLAARGTVFDPERSRTIAS